MPFFYSVDDYEKFLSNSEVYCPFVACGLCVDACSARFHGELVPLFAEIGIDASRICVFVGVGSVVYTYGSVGLVSGAQTSRSPFLILLFFLQLLLNFMWSLCFFYLMMPLLAFVVLLVLLFVLVAYIAGCYRLKKYIAFINIPYVGWLLFAAYLNVYVVLNN